MQITLLLVLYSKMPKHLSLLCPNIFSALFSKTCSLCLTFGSIPFIFRHKIIVDFLLCFGKFTEIYTFSEDSSKNYI
jgi:hypothetical protein